MNKLYFGDNLDVLREYVEDESVDLIYLDPPFNSQAQYNLLFDRQDDDAASAQAGAFRDTWAWGDEAEWSYQELMRMGGETARFIAALRSALKESNTMAYLAMMAVRLQELHRKLKPTGSIYLHCDPTASHYLKILMDAVFGANMFRNEIVWQRTGAHGSSKRFAPVHDTILFYTKSEAYVWNPAYMPLPKETSDAWFNNVETDTGRRFNRNTLTAPGVRSGSSGQPWRGIDPSAKGRHWAVPGFAREVIGDLDTIEALEALDKMGRVFWPKKAGGTPMLKLYLDESKGVPALDMWTDIRLQTSAKERLGYPTQKPLALMDRIVQASSKPGDLVLDPFCGCGTTIESAEQLGREWTGIDVAVHAVKVIEARLGEYAGRTQKKVNYITEGMPRDFASAVKLAEKDKYQFQWWANYLFNPHALREQKKGADRGVDGELFFPNGPGRPWGRMLTSVKGGGQVGPSMVRDFGRVLDREKAQLGLFICLHSPTREMSREASSMGFADIVHGDIPRLQIVAIEEWFKGKQPLLPPLEHLPSAAFSGRRRPAPAKRGDPEQPELPLSFKGGKEPKRHFNLRMVSGAA